MLFKDLVGQTLLSIKLKEGRIYLTTDKGKYWISAYGDCCSWGWLNISAPIPHLPSKITRFWSPAPSYECGAHGKRKEDLQEDTIGYGEAFTLENGERFVYDVWNSSNGYYGSSTTISPMDE